MNNISRTLRYRIILEAQSLKDHSRYRRTNYPLEHQSRGFNFYLITMHYLRITNH